MPSRLAAPASPRLGDRAFDAVALGLVFLAYFTVFLVGRGGAGIADAALSSLINLLPLIPLGAAARAVIRRRLFGAGPGRQIVGHVALAVAFTYAWHWLLTVLVGMRSGGSLTEFAVRAFFPNTAYIWQLLQGVTIYALIAALTHARAQPELPSFLAAGPQGEKDKEPALTRYFIRRGDEIFPVDVAQIVTISGADDYAEVATAEGRHLVRTSLAEFEATLDRAQFLRVHRSRIVNLARIDRAEPAGDGRIILHMSNGEAVQTSRAGARLMRERVI